jgi:uncharacterized membrane protein
MEENVRAALSYVLGFITGIIFYLTEKESDFVRFHAMQSTVTFLGFFILSYGLQYLFFFIGHFLASLVNLVAFITWLVCIIKAYQGEWFKLPIAGEIAYSLIKKAS